MRTCVRMEIACVIDCRLTTPGRPGHSGGLRPGRLELDPVAAAELTEGVARALEGIGAGVETERTGEVFFAVGGAGRAVGAEVLSGVAPTRVAARAAAERGEGVVTGERLGAFLGPLPTAVLVDRLGDPRRAEDLVTSLGRLGIGTLGELRRLT